MLTDTAEYAYQLDDQFFADLNGLEVQSGSVNVILNVRKTSGAYLLDFQTEGVVQVICDLCLDEMDQPISSTDSLKVKLGDEYAELEDLIIIPEEEGYINVAWFIYEFIALSIPMKHIHAPGECNEEMLDKLSSHLRTAGDDDDDFEDEEADNVEPREIDPRWSELKKILDNN